MEWDIETKAKPTVYWGRISSTIICNFRDFIFPRNLTFCLLSIPLVCLQSRVLWIQFSLVLASLCWVTSSFRVLF